MNIKQKTNSVIRLIDNKVPIEQVYKRLLPLVSQAKLTLAELNVGAGYLQWTLPGNDWIAFDKLDDSEKPAAAQMYIERRDKVKSLLKGVDLANAILTVPDDEECVYFRQVGTDMEVALVAWAFKYPDRPCRRELEAWITKINVQDVSIGFTWDERRLPGISFKLEGQPRVTDNSGLFRLDGKLPVGKNYNVKTAAGQEFILTVEKGKSEYLFDLTQYFNVSLTATMDGKPLVGNECTMMFGGKQYTLTTDATGSAQIQLPLQCDSLGQIAEVQSDCIISCNGQSQSKAPKSMNEILAYSFVFETPQPEVKEKEPEPEPEKPKDNPVEMVSITILDYEGFPVTDMPVVLTTKKKGDIKVVTDKEGKCQLQKDCFTNKEKVKVKFIVTPEYQETHDIHYEKKPKEKKK